jgi:hypothetical protein
MTDAQDIESMFWNCVAHADEWEPWPHRQFKAFNRYDLEPPNFIKAMQTIASMYWQGMEREFRNALEISGELTDTWAQSYVTYIQDSFPEFPEVTNTPGVSPKIPEIPKISMDAIHIPTTSPYFIITHVSEAGTSETGQVISADTESFDSALSARITADKLRDYTSARIEKLPSLKDLGILRVHDLDVYGGYTIYCWLYDDADATEDSDVKPVLHVLKPFNARKPAIQCSDAENAVYKIVPGQTRASTVICLEDVIVKINIDADTHIFTKAKKTYYTLSLCPIPHVNPVHVDYAYAHIDKSITTKTMIARYIFGVPSRDSLQLGAYYENGTLHVCSINNNSIYGNAQISCIRSLDHDEKEWLRRLAREVSIISDNIQSHMNLDQLISEYT